MSFDLLAAAADGLGGTPAWAMLAYLAAGVFFILALRGLSSPATSPRSPRLSHVTPCTVGSYTHRRPSYTATLRPPCPRA